MHTPEVVAHRGYALCYPENTLVGVKAAIDAGARYIEVDIQLTADGLPVLFHDRTLERVCGGQGAIHEKSAKQLLKLHASEPARFERRFAKEPIATLKDFCELLARHPEVTAFVEIKRIAIERFGGGEVFSAVTKVLEPVIAKCVLISFSIGFLEIVRRQRPATAIGAVVDSWEQSRSPEIRTMRPDYLFCGVDGLPASGLLHPPLGAKLVVYEVADGVLALKLAERGVDFVETFACAEMLTYLRTLARSPQKRVV